MELKKYKLWEIAKVVNGSTPSTACPQYYDGNIVWITPKDLSDQKSKYIEKGERNITEAGYNSCSTQMIPANNLLLTSRAPIGLLAINVVDCCTNQGFKNIVVDKTKVDVDYLYYYLKYHIKEIEALGAGTTFKEVSKNSLENYVLSLPELNIQRKIAKVLSNLDSKIKLNKQINQNLEALARQLYDYWFVQFDFPDENGKPYKSSGGMLAFNKDIKRDIPVNWKVLNLKNCIQHINTGLNPRTNFQFGGNIKYVTVKNLTTEGTIDYSSCDYIDDVARTKVHKRSQIAIGDILYASICPLGRTHLITSEPKDWDINESVFSIRPNKTIITSEYLNMLLKDDYYIEKLTQSSSGSIFQGIRIKELENTKIIVPSSDILINYTKVIKPIINNQSTNEAEKQALIKQRNELLPLLMNGQLNSDLSSC